MVCNLKNSSDLSITHDRVVKNALETTDTSHSTQCTVQRPYPMPIILDQRLVIMLLGLEFKDAS